MLHERVAEALHDVACELLELCLGKVAGGKEFLEHYLVHELADFGIFAAFLHGIEAAEVAYGAQDGVGTVQKGNLPLVVRSL